MSDDIDEMLKPLLAKAGSLTDAMICVGAQLQAVRRELRCRGAFPRGNPPGSVNEVSNRPTA